MKITDIRISCVDYEKKFSISAITRVTRLPKKGGGGGEWLKTNSLGRMAIPLLVVGLPPAWIEPQSPAAGRPTPWRLHWLLGTVSTTWQRPGTDCTIPGETDTYRSTQSLLPLRRLQFSGSPRDRKMTSMAQRQLSVHPEGLPAGPKTHTDPVQVNKKLVRSRLHPIKELQNGRK